MSTTLVVNLVWLAGLITLLLVVVLFSYFGPRGRAAREGNRAVAHFRVGELEAAEVSFRRIFDDCRRRHDLALELHTLVNLGACLIAQRRLHEATPLLAWVVRSQRAKPRQRAAALYNLAWIAYLEFDFDEAERGLAAARLEVARPKRDLAAFYELMAARLAGRKGDLDAARTHFEAAARLAARARDRGLPGQVAHSRGILEYCAGNRDSGLDLVLRSAASLQAADRGELAGRTMLGLAHIARARGDAAAAEKLEAAAGRFRGITPMPSPEDCAAYVAKVLPRG